MKVDAAGLDGEGDTARPTDAPRGQCSGAMPKIGLRRAGPGGLLCHSARAQDDRPPLVNFALHQRPRASLGRAAVGIDAHGMDPGGEFFVLQDGIELAVQAVDDGRWRALGCRDEKP